MENIMSSLLKNKKITTITLGCKVNQYEIDALQELLEQAGAILCSNEETADICIVNTCSVTNMADRKSRQMLHRAKKKNPNIIVVAMGCYVETAKETIKQDEYVDLVIGNNKKKDIVSILEHYLDEKYEDEIETIIDINATKEYETLSLTKVGEHTRAYVKVQDGCNQFCTYCIIPYARGRVRSRKKEDILTEVKQLVKNGYQEIVITGIHISSYGIDLEDTNLLDLLEALKEIEGLERIRLGSLEPRIITEEFVKVIKENERICPHFHLSLQSGDNNTLKRKNRKYTKEEFREKVALLRSYYNLPAITTDIIVGFPGETKEEFLSTYEYLKEINLYEIHVFKYSKRTGTIAATMENQVKEEEKTVRSNRLLELTREQKEQYEASFVGKEVKVLTEETLEAEKNTYYVGHTPNYIKVLIKDNGQLKSNQIYSVTMTDEKIHDILVGTLV